MSSCQVLSFLAPISHMYIMIMMQAINGIDCNMTQNARAKIDHTYPLMKSWKCPGFEKTYNIKANIAMKYASREGYFIEQSSIQKTMQAILFSKKLCTSFIFHWGKHSDTQDTSSSRGFVLTVGLSIVGVRAFFLSL